MRVQSLGREDPLEEGTATHSRIVAWRIPWTQEPYRAPVLRVTKSRTRLKQLSQDLETLLPSQSHKPHGQIPQIPVQ